MVAGFARPQTEAEVASLALGHLGLTGIADLNDDNIRARTARGFYATVRDTLLREKWWSFAAANITPAADPKESIGGVLVLALLSGKLSASKKSPGRQRQPVGWQLAQHRSD